jgi:N-acetylglucosamine-6-phosphate deacetylase
MKRTVIRNGILITPKERVDGGWLLVEDGRITALGSGVPPAADLAIDAAGRFIAPGFIDLHAQGFRGYDLWDPSEEDFVKATRQMASTGVTAAQASVDALPEVCRLMRPRIGRSDGGCRLLGLYFEVPFISLEKRGAIPPDRVRPPSVDLARQIMEWSRGILSMITIAPEQPGALDLVRLFRQAAGPCGSVVVALGHTKATYEEALAGIEAGMTHCTHLFNAMPPVLHREPGAAGALLTRPEVSVELVCDGIHLHPAVVRMAVACKGAARTCLITDCVSARDRDISSGAPRLPDGTLAGSVLSMDRAVANVRRFAGVSLPEAVEMATLSPARAVGCDKTKGSLAPGKDADVVLFDADMHVSMTMIGGEAAWQTE